MIRRKKDNMTGIVDTWSPLQVPHLSVNDVSTAKMTDTAFNWQGFKIAVPRASNSRRTGRAQVGPGDSIRVLLSWTCKGDAYTCRVPRRQHKVVVDGLECIVGGTDVETLELSAVVDHLTWVLATTIDISFKISSLFHRSLRTGNTVNNDCAGKGNGSQKRRYKLHLKIFNQQRSINA